MTYANLIYLGQITDRVPVIGLFTPSHIGGDAPPIAFGEVFNVSRFIEDSGIAIVEWDDVKNPDSEVLEDLGCWNVWEAVQYYEHHPRGSTVPDWVGLGSYMVLETFFDVKLNIGIGFTQTSLTLVDRIGSRRSLTTSMTSAALSGPLLASRTRKIATRI